MVSILLSRIIGFFREWILAQTVGATGETDVYYASFTVPDFINHIMAAGALTISFIPIISSCLSSANEEKAKKVFRFISSLMGGLLIILIVIAEIFAPYLAKLAAPGFYSYKHELLVFLIRIILPAQFFFYWGGLAIAVQQTYGKFFLPAIAPIIYNVMIIFLGVVLQKIHPVIGFSIGVLIGSVLGHGLIQWIGLRKLGYSIKPYFVFSGELVAVLKRYIFLTIPIMFGFSIVIADEWIGKFFASLMKENAVSYLQYARIEMRIPVAVIGQAAGIASFPFLTRLWASGEYEKYGKVIIREIQKIWFLSLLAATFFFVHYKPITHFIYGGGKFNNEDISMTADALKFFCGAVLFSTVQGLLSRGFYASSRTWLPSILGTFISLFSVVLYYYFGKHFGVNGLALAGSLAFSLYAILLWVLLFKHIRKYYPLVSFSSFYLFIFITLFVSVFLVLISKVVLDFGIYQGTRLTAFFDVIVAMLIIYIISLLLVKTVLRRFTDGTLF